MLRSNEYEEIKADYDKISKESFDAGYIPPQGMSFLNSDALFPPTGLEAILATEFEKQCHILCFGPFPSWIQFQKRFKEIRVLL